LTVLVVSRFLLDVRNLNASPNGSTNASFSLPRFRIASQHSWEGIVQEFGTLTSNDIITETLLHEDNVELDPCHTDPVIELVAFP